MENEEFEKVNIIKSIYYTNDETIKAIMELYNIERFDLDCTYSTGCFWKDIPQPINKTDLYPQKEGVIKANSEILPFGDNSFKNIMCDLPFVISGKTYKTNKKGSSIIAKRFEGYETFDALKKNYYKTLKELYRICEKDGIVVFKCQDSVSSGKNHFSHVVAMNMAIEIGFYPKDLFILAAKSRLTAFNGTKWKKQYHARKFHSYFLIFQKTKNKVNYDFSHGGYKWEYDNQ